jgi:dinuclear metal center YbgI/SA1388 family protein
MPPIAVIVQYLDALLEVDGFEDLGPNGLQVPGGAETDIVVTGVSAQLELFQRARDVGAGLVLAHHGLFWDFQPRELDVRMARRLRILLEHGIALAGYHLPLDAHPEHGNNALLANRLGCDRTEPFGSHHGRTIGVVGHFAGDGVPIAELVERVAMLDPSRDPLVFDAGPRQVRTIGLISGSAAGNLDEAIAAGLDAFLTGEPKEHVMADAREAEIHFIAAGHYATETLGIQRLGDLVAERFGVRHEFVDIPNPV